MKSEVALKAMVEPACKVPALTVVGSGIGVVPAQGQGAGTAFGQRQVAVCSTPPKVVVALLPPALKVAVTPVVTVPVPAKEPIVLENPRFKVAPLTVKAELALRAVVEPACSVPALTVVTPL